MKTNSKLGPGCQQEPCSPSLAHDAAWENHFIKPMIQIMQEKGIGKIRITINGGKAAYVIEPVKAKIQSVRAFRVVTDYFEKPEATIIRTTTQSRAKHRCWDSAHCAGYPIKWASLKVRRAPEYDDAKLIKDQCYSEDFARSILPENVGVLAQPGETSTNQ